MEKNKARKVSISGLDELLNTIPELERCQIDERMRFAARVDDLMRVRGISRSKFAEQLNRQPSEITKWLSGTHNLTQNTMVEIAWGLGVAIESLFVPHWTVMVRHIVEMHTSASLVSQKQQLHSRKMATVPLMAYSSTASSVGVIDDSPSRYGAA